MINIKIAIFLIKIKKINNKKNKPFFNTYIKMKILKIIKIQIAYKSKILLIYSQLIYKKNKSKLKNYKNNNY